MTWPLGYGKPSCRFEAGADGTLYVNGVAVSESNGWIDVPLPATATVRGAPREVSVRVRLVPDESGESFLYAEQIEVAGRRHNSVHALMLAEGTQWIAPLTRAIHTEMVRRSELGSASNHDEAARVPTRPLRPVTGKIATKSADEPGEFVSADAIGAARNAAS